MNKNVLDSIRELLAQVLPPNATARLYGSQARGDAHHGSDWDILIVMDKEELLLDDYDTVTYPLTKLGWELGADINPIMYTKTQSHYNMGLNESPMKQNINNVKSL